MVHIAESTVGRRYAGWFIKNTERTQKILDDLQHTPLPNPPKHAQTPSSAAGPIGAISSDNQSKGRSGQKVAWGTVKVA